MDDIDYIVLVNTEAHSFSTLTAAAEYYLMAMQFSCVDVITTGDVKAEADRILQHRKAG